MENKKKKLLILAVITVCLIIGTIIILFSGEKDEMVQIELSDSEKGIVHQVTPNSKCVMENEKFLLELDEATMGISLTDKVTGEVFKSTQDYTEGNVTWNGLCGSGISLEFYSGNSTVPITISVKNESPQKEIQYYEDGFDANLYFEKYEFQMQLQVRLAENGISTYIPGDSIKEGETYLLGAVWLYPMMGSTFLGEEQGYMVIPEGSGAIIDLKDNQGKFKNPYSKRIYGDNVGIDAAEINTYGAPVVTEPQNISMPVFGAVYTQRKCGFLGIVTNGEYNAELLAYPNGVTTPYNWVGIKFHVRDIYTKQTAKSSGVPTYESKGDIRDMGIKFLFVDGEEADYAGLANQYQNYLVEQGVLKKQEDSFKVKIDFLGADSKKWFLFNQTVCMTTVEDLNHIIFDLLDSEVTDILPVYFGWQKNGITLNCGSDDLSIESGLGSKKELLNLSKKLKKQGITLTLQQEFLLANSARLYNTGKDIVKGINQVIIEKPTNQKLFETMYYMTPMRAMILADEYVETYGNGEVAAISISGITDTLFSYYSGGTTYSRETCAGQYKEAVEELEFEKVGMVSPNAYMWDQMTQYYDMSLATSNYNFIAEEIPFLPIVLRGYVPYWASYTNFEPNENKFFLKLLEYGAYPSFLITEESPVQLRNTNSSYIYTSEYSILKERIVDYEQRIGEVLKQVAGVGIEDHAYIAEGVVQIQYKNGMSLLINYTDQEYQYKDIVISPLSYYLMK